LGVVKQLEQVKGFGWRHRGLRKKIQGPLSLLTLSKKSAPLEPLTGVLGFVDGRFWPKKQIN